MSSLCLVGSLAVRQLHERKSKKGDADSNRYSLSGSESSEPLISDNLGVVSQLKDYAGVLSEWLRHDDNLSRLLQAPILVSTIDYLIPANRRCARWSSNRSHATFIDIRFDPG